MPHTSLTATIHQSYNKSAFPIIRGIVTPVVTPLLDREKLDLASLERLTNRLIDGGVSALFLLGTTGEFAAMSHELRREFVRATMQLVQDRIPVFTGISDTSLVESLHLAHCAADAGVAACVVTAPYYYRPNPVLMGDYLCELASASPLPLILYNMPENTGVNFDLETVKRIIDHPKFIGIKDSGGDLDYFAKLCNLAMVRHNFSVLMGPDSLLGKAMTLGAAGGVNSGSNLYPEIFVGLYNAYQQGDTAAMTRFQTKIELLNRIYAVPQKSLGVPCGLKAALALLGVCGEYMIPPYRSVCEQERTAIRELIEQLGLN
ncbi:MAG: dihydrodipicolinate synthase family protein [Planctomycetia bacterium]|nr:dihydrodipicolinate synthase family protein [Planctomycetia bacterium]